MNYTCIGHQNGVSEQLQLLSLRAGKGARHGSRDRRRLRRQG